MRGSQDPNSRRKGEAQSTNHHRHPSQGDSPQGETENRGYVKVSMRVFLQFYITLWPGIHETWTAFLESESLSHVFFKDMPAYERQSDWIFTSRNKLDLLFGASQSDSCFGCRHHPDDINLIEDNRRNAILAIESDELVSARLTSNSLLQ